MGAPAGQVRGKRGAPGRGGPMKRGGRGRGNINGGPPPLGRPMRGGPMGMRGVGRPPLPPPPMRGGRGMGRGMQGPPRGMTGPPRGMGGPPRGMAGAPRGMPGAPRGMPGAPRGMSGPPRGITGGPRGRGGPGSRGMPPHGVRPPPPGVRPPPGLRGPPPGMRPPPPMMMMRPPGPPPGRGGFRGGMRGGMKPPFLRGGMRGGVRGGRIMRRTRPSLKNVDLSKPWVTDAIRQEFGKKDELLVAAKNTQAQEDWAKYREQREKCSRIYQEAESANGEPAEDCHNWEDYVHEEDEMVSEEEGTEESVMWYEDYDEQEISYSCDTCERDFFTQEQYEQHMSEHQTCNLDGCKFTAHEKIVAKHIEMQHATGLFNKIKLDTPEDVAKWIESRKKNYPSKENIEKRYQKQEAMIKKGIRIGKNPNKFGRDKFRLASTAKPRTKRLVKKKRLRPPKVSLIDEKADWNGNMFPFRGTADLFKDCLKEEKDSISDDEEEWDSTPNVVAPKVNNSLGCLMAAYDSDNEDEDLEETTQLPNKSAPVEPAHDSDNEPPDEVKIVKKTEQEPVNPPLKPQTISSRRLKKQRKLPPKKGVLRKNVQTTRKRSQTDNFPHSRFKRRKVTLLEKLLENEIRHERNMLLQCVRYVVQNNFFKS